MVIAIGKLDLNYLRPPHWNSSKRPNNEDYCSSDKFQSILATIYNQSQLAERKHVGRYWTINIAVTAVPLIAHPSPIDVADATAKPMGHFIFR